MKEKLVRPIFRFFNSRTKNAEIYINNGSVWLIFTNEKKWVIELTKEGTLWYNYYFFDNIFKFFSLNVVENQDYITEWVENLIQNGVKHTVKNLNSFRHVVEYTIQNGMKETKHNTFKDGLAMEEAIQNGIKETHDDAYHHTGRVDGVIKNGVRQTNPHFLEILNPINFEPVIKEMKRMNEVNIVLEEGIKKTKYCELHSLMRADHIIRDGIKETHWKRVDNHPTFIDSIIQTKNPS